MKTKTKAAKKTHSDQEEQIKEQVEGIKEDTLRTREKYIDRGKLLILLPIAPMRCNLQRKNWTAKIEILLNRFAWNSTLY
jgi:hypothetical protein